MLFAILRADLRQPRNRSEPPLPDPIGIHVVEFRQRHDRGDGVTATLHDKALSSRRFIEDLTEASPDIQGANRSHGTIIGP